MRYDDAKFLDFVSHLVSDCIAASCSADQNYKI